MILDSQIQFSAAQSVAAAVGDIVSTNVADTGQSLDSSAGAGQVLLVKTVAAVTSGGAATLAVVLQDSADNATFADVMATAPRPLAALGANQVIARVPLPTALRRYWRVVYRIAGATTTGGSVSAYLANNVQAQQILPSGFQVA